MVRKSTCTAHKAARARAELCRAPPLDHTAVRGRRYAFFMARL